jgi:tetrathionate reductase subunit B
MEPKKQEGSMTRRNLLQKGAQAGAGVVLLGAGAALTSGIVGCKEETSAVKMASSEKKPIHWGFLVDLNRCIGCKACSVACKTEFDVRLGVFRASVKELESGSYPNTKRTFLPWLCNHCDTPICIKDCPVDEMDAVFTWADGTEEKYKKRATYKRPDGPVLIDQDRCVGCGACVDLCPYNVRYQDPVREGEVGGIADKCTLCVHRLDKGLVPACVNTCQADARVAGNLNDPNSKISKHLKSLKTAVIHTDYGTDPQCRYASLDPKTYDEGRDVR